MMVLRKWPAWNSLAILGDENSTMILFRPAEGSFGSLSPAAGLEPYRSPSWKMLESTREDSEAGENANDKFAALAAGGCTRLFCGN